MTKVLLVSMPFGALERQALGISLLKAKLAERDMPCDIRYLNFAFAEFVGAEEYRWVNYELPYTAFAGDWSFTAALYGEQPGAAERYIQEILQAQWGLGSNSIQRLLRIRAMVEPFLEHVVAAVPWHEYRLVGFTSTFEQNIASLALARRLKHRHPNLAIAFGGANWEAEMGLELHRRFPFVDYVCSGESENSFPALVEAIGRAKPNFRRLSSIPGIVYRRDSESCSTGPAEMVRDMDGLPLPDYSDYFRDLAQCTAGASVLPTLLIETSRGCWWGAKSHCTFCGLNGGSMAFRSKSPQRAMDELSHLVSRWRIDMVEAVDNILDMRYFQELLPELARSTLGINIFYEVKANLTRRQIALLRAAGVNRIQPGIESLSDHVLRLMRKGTTGLRNVQMMKWCKEYGVAADWNLLYGFPGETPQDYSETLELLRAVRFLPPPTACGPVRLDRFSPYFERSGDFGMINVRPMTAYAHLYPFSPESLHKIAYYFDYDYAPGADPRGFADEVIAYATDWQQQPEMGGISAVSGAGDRLVLLDTRSDRVRSELILTGPERAAYEFCDEQHSAPSIARHLRHPENQVRGFLDSMVANKFMVSDGTNYLSLALYSGADEPRSHDAAEPSFAILTV
jgi:ribosomal peptide maturation radical SAM protein 1